MLDDLAGLLADPLEGIEARPLDWYDLDIDARELRRERLAARGPPLGGSRVGAGSSVASSGAAVGASVTSTPAPVSPMPTA